MPSCGLVASDLLSGNKLRRRLARSDRRALGDLAAEKGVTASQLAVACVLSKGSSIVPLVGARTRKQLAESLGALDVAVAPLDIQRIEAAIPLGAVAGTRYDQHQMRVLDSER